MKYTWLDDYCLKLAGAHKDYKPQWAAERYLLADKMFALKGTNKEEQAIITLKLDPAYGEALRQKYPDITPGYYMNKLHWNSVKLDGQVPDDVLKDMIKMSHQLILSSFSQKRQKEITENYKNAGN